MRVVQTIVIVGSLCAPGVVEAAQADDVPYGNQAPGAGSERIDLAALLAGAWQSHPELQAATRRADAARASAPAVTAPEDPRLNLLGSNESLTAETLGESPDSFLEVQWEQPVRRPSVRDASVRASGAAVGAADAALAAARARRRARILSLYSELWRLDRTLDLLRESRVVLESLTASVRARYESGSGIQEPVLRAQVVSRRLLAEIEHRSRDRRSTSIALAEAAGLDPGTPMLRAEELPELDLPLMDETVGAAAEVRSPDVAEAQAALAAAEAGVDLARLARKADWSWNAGYQYRGSLDPVVMAGVGVPIPVRRDTKQQALLLQAERTRDAAAAELAAARLRARTAALDTLDEAHHAGRIAAEYRSVLGPLAQSAQDAAAAAYAAGGAEMFLVLDDLDRALRIRVDEVAERSNQVRAAADLEALIGRRVVLVAEEGSGR